MHFYHLQFQHEQKSKVTAECQGSNWYITSSHHMQYQQHDTTSEWPKFK